MNSYVLIVIADILLAVTFAFQKKYQCKAGISIKAGLLFTILSGAVSAVMFFAVNGFSVRITWLSVILAIMFATVITLYLFCGFRIMKNGNMSIYTLFLMSGGMIVPYIYGVFFLNEELTFIRILGLLLIVAAITVANLNKEKVDKVQLVLCVAVFLLNGASSVISKAHQVSWASQLVSSSDFVFLIMVSKVVLSLVALLFIKKKCQDEVPFQFKSVALIIAFAAITDGLSFMLMLMGAVNLPATVLYPLVTGGTIILSSLVDCVIYKERLSKKQWIGAGVAFIGTLMFL